MVLAEKRRFFQKMGCSQQFERLFEFLPNIHFFVKDRRSRMIAASPGIVRRFRAKEEAEIIGKSDYDFFPAHLADRFVADDRKVLASGKPLTNRVEIWFTDEGLLDWFVTNKLPIFGPGGALIGVMGTVTNFDGQPLMDLPLAQVSAMVDYIGEHHRENLTVEQVAKHFSISTRQLHRRFVKTLGMNVQQFMVRMRIQSACKLLTESDLPLAVIADKLGFCYQSAFTRQFRETMGMTPRRFKNRYHTGCSAKVADFGKGSRFP